MVKKSYLDIIKYPLIVWLVFEVIAFVAGFTSYLSISTQIMLGTNTLFLAILFGIWVGRRSAKAFDYLWVSMIAALMLTLIVGFVNVVLSYALGAYSQSFISYVSGGGSAAGVGALILSVAITTWVQMGMLAIVGAAIAYEFYSKK